jgi:hypothetical protein
MASIPAPTGPFRATARLTPPLGQLWQVPTFLLGLLAFAAACVAHPPWHAVHPSYHDPALDDLRELLKRPDFDGDRALKLGAEAVHQAGTPAESAEARYLLGSAYIVLAERAGPGKGQDHWRAARANLEQARALGIPDDDRPRLDYRLAKALAQTGEPPAQVVSLLAPSIEAGADDPTDAARGYGLLAEAYLKLPKPDLEAALAATEKQIDQPVVSPELLAPARLRRGELLARLNRPAEEVADALRNITAPPEVAAQARRLLARTLEHMESWEQAAAAWRDIRDDAKSPPRDPDTVLYHLGLCEASAGHRDEAARAWDDCLRRDGPGEEGPAAAVRVAELRLRDGQFEPALAALERAVRDVTQPGGWHNSLVTEAAAREVFEAGCRKAAAAGAFEMALRLAGAYERLALPGRAQELRAEAATAGARAAQDRAQAAPADEARRLYAEAEALRCQAGEALEKAAAAQKEPDEQAERFWSAANSFLEGRDALRAAAAFERFLAIARRDEAATRRYNARLNEAWYKLAVAYRTAGKPELAAENFGKAANSLAAGSPYVYRARYEWALALRVSDGAGPPRWTDEAAAALEKNLAQLRKTPIDRDEEAREKTLYALGDLYFDRREQRASVSRAIETLEDALRDFPGNAQVLAARYELAESYRLRADQLNASLSQERLTFEARLEIEKKVMDDREKAVAHYQALSGALERRTARDDADERLLVYALSEAADVRFLAGGYEKSGEMYEALAERLKGRKGFEFEYASALANVARGYQTATAAYSTTDPDYQGKLRAARQKVQRALRDIRAELPRLDPPTRQRFEEWLKSFDAPAPGVGH